jgi:hypothetical protein
MGSRVLGFGFWVQDLRLIGCRAKGLGLKAWDLGLGA